MRPLIFLLPLLSLVSACDRQSEAPSQDKAAENSAQAIATPAPPAPTGAGLINDFKGTLAPETPFEGPDGRPVKLAEFAGRPVLVNLWATWCASCVVEMPTLDALAAARGDTLRVVAISMDIEGRRAVDPFLAKAGLKNLPPYLDKKNDLMLALKADTLPVTILYDSQGREVWRMIGEMDWNSEKAAALIDQAS